MRSSKNFLVVILGKASVLREVSSYLCNLSESNQFVRIAKIEPLPDHTDSQNL